VKPHLHQMCTDVVVAAFSGALGFDLDTLNIEMAIELLANDSLFLSSRGRQACLDALSELFMSFGAADLVKQPDGPMGPRVVNATLGHFALVVTNVRNALESAAGTRSSARSGAIGDGHFPLWVADVRRLVRTQAADAEAHDGLVLVDGSNPARSLPQFYFWAIPWVSSVPSARPVLSVWVKHCMRFGCVMSVLALTFPAQVAMPAPRSYWKAFFFLH